MVKPDSVAFLMKFMPSFIRKRIEGRKELKKVLANMNWLFADKIIKVLGGLIIGIFVIRYLGPQDYGLFSYIIATISLFGPLHNLGLPGITIREIVNYPKDKEKILGSAFSLRFLGSLVLLTTGVLVIAFARPGNTVALIMAILIALSFVMRTFDTADYYFRSQVKSRYTVISQNIGFVLASLAKIGFIFGGLSVIFFAGAQFLEFFIAAILFIWFLKRFNISIFSWKFDKSWAKNLIKDSWPLIFAGLFAKIFLHIDQFMLGIMTNDQTVGEYGAAVRISMALYFIPSVIIKSAYPYLVENKKTPFKAYLERVSQTGASLAVLAYIVTIPIFIFSGPIVLLLFGKEYTATSSILAIHVLSNIFVYVGLLRSPWIIKHNVTKVAPVMNAIGGLFNIGLNLVLIPALGGQGAAIATLVSYFLVYFFINLFFKSTRKLFYIQLKSFALIPVFREIKKMVKS